MQEKLKLNPGERLVEESHQMKGPLQETDIYTYAVMNAAGEKVGSVLYTDTTNMRGQRTQEVEQRDIAGKMIVKERWSGR